MIDWKLNEQGNVVLNPLMGFDTAIAAEMACLLRLRFAANEAELRSGGQSLQLVMTPAQAGELARMLQQMADAATTGRSPDQKN